jgi:hypothetical protein
LLAGGPWQDWKKQPKFGKNYRIGQSTANLLMLARAPQKQKQKLPGVFILILISKTHQAGEICKPPIFGWEVFVYCNLAI